MVDWLTYIPILHSHLSVPHPLENCSNEFTLYFLICICSLKYASLFLCACKGDGTPLQYSCLENPMDSGAWWATVHGAANSRTRLSDFTSTVHFHALEKEMATHSNVLAWRILGTGEPGGLLSMGSHRVRHDWRDLAAAAAAVEYLLALTNTTSGIQCARTGLVNVFHLIFITWKNHRSIYSVCEFSFYILLYIAVHRNSCL